MRPLSLERSRNPNIPYAKQTNRSFAEPYGHVIELLAARSPGLNDLKLSFPGILFALATEYGNLSSRQQAYSMICLGRSLKAIAKTLNLPWWMRRLPPQAFAQPLSGPLPDSENFSKQISNAIPQKLQDLPVWLRKVTRAHQLCDENFALWIAKTPLLYSNINEVSDNDAALELLAAWAWYSQHPTTYAYQLIQTPWHPNINIHKALDAAKNWFNRVKLVLFIGDHGIEDCWLEGGRIKEYDIVPLRTAHDFITEAQAMNNCLDQYADQIRFHRVRVFSIRHDGVPVANIEIGPHEDDRTMPSIEQVRGPKNRRVNQMIWQLAYAWLGQQNFSARPNGPNWRSVSTQPNMHPLWRPYRMHLDKANIPSYDLSIFNLDKTEKLLMQLEDLALLESD